jgi:DNA-binding transcriptional LysR family regulator
LVSRSSWAQLLQVISLGRTTAVLPESCRANLLEGLTAVPILDAPPVTTVIAWPPHSRSRHSPTWCGWPLTGG